MSVVQFPRGEERVVESNGEPPDNGDMEARVAKLEQIAEKTRESLASLDTRLTRLETRSEQFATREDVVKAKHETVMWIVGAAVLTQLIPTLLALLKGLGWIH